MTLSTTLSRIIYWDSAINPWNLYPTYLDGNPNNGEINPSASPAFQNSISSHITTLYGSSTFVSMIESSNSPIRIAESLPSFGFSQSVGTFSGVTYGGFVGYNLATTASLAYFNKKGTWVAEKPELTVAHELFHQFAGSVDPDSTPAYLNSAAADYYGDTVRSQNKVALELDYKANIQAGYFAAGEATFFTIDKNYTGSEDIDIARLGSQGNDTLLMSARTDNSRDLVMGRAGNDSIEGGGGNDHLFGGDGTDTISGGLGNDRLFGEAGNDSLNGGDGLDTLEGGAGADTLNGGNGFDVLSFADAASAITITRVSNTIIGSGGDPASDTYGDTYLNFEKILGSNFHDVIALSDRPFGVDALDGDDLVTGGSNSDTIHGRNGNDTINGGSGNDVISGGDGIDVIDGGAGNDDIHTGTGGGSVLGGTGSDLIFASSGTVDGGVGNDKIVLMGYETTVVKASAGNDIIDARNGAAQYVIGANTGADVLLYNDPGVLDFNEGYPLANLAVWIKLDGYHKDDLTFIYNVKNVSAEYDRFFLDGTAIEWKVSGDLLVKIKGTSSSVVIKNLVGKVAHSREADYLADHVWPGLDNSDIQSIQLALEIEDAEGKNLELNVWRYGTLEPFKDGFDFKLGEISGNFMRAETDFITTRPSPSDFIA